jgi:hypothetical protein
MHHPLLRSSAVIAVHRVARLAVSEDFRLQQALTHSKYDAANRASHLLGFAISVTPLTFIGRVKREIFRVKREI